MLRIGTSGYSYPDWKGSFYPAGVKQSDMLSFYASEFDTVEINFTYYQIPSARTLARMAQETPDDFRFTLKANQAMTHDRRGEPAIFQEFCTALAPLQAQGKLGCVLAQFPTAFKNTKQNRAYLAYLRAQMGDLPVAVEFRHRSWVREPVFQELSSLNLGFCCVDQPQFEVLLPPVAVVTAPIAYVRFHGRNAAQWWHKSHARYDYCYTQAELAEWVPRLQKLRAEAQQVYVFANNCYKSQSIAAARQLKALMGIATPKSVQLGLF